jgi:hypothetical protein
MSAFQKMLTVVTIYCVTPQNLDTYNSGRMDMDPSVLTQILSTVVYLVFTVAVNL